MKTTASDILIDAIHDWGVDVVFGLDGQPVLAITGLQYHDLVQTHTQQDVELDKVLVQAVADPYEPPMPPKVSMKQAEKFAESLLRGEPNRGKIITVAEDRVRELV